MHEILTVQLGPRANHMGAHFWSVQESYFSLPRLSLPDPHLASFAPEDSRSFAPGSSEAYDPPAHPVDHDIHWREGVSGAGEDTYTPRVLIYDLKGGFGGVRGWGDEEGGVGGEGGGGEVWAGEITQIKAPLPPSPPGQLSIARHWSAHNRVLYHPKSLIPLHAHTLSSSSSSFSGMAERWESGEDMFADLDREVDVLDRDVRGWAEECDALQGVQVVTGADDAWAGFAKGYVERIRDEFGKVAVWVWGVEEAVEGGRAKRMLRTVNAARSMYEISAHASVYIPLSVPSRLPHYVQLDRSSPWQTSALLSTVWESVTLPSRLRADQGKRGLLNDLEAALNINGNQRIANVQMSVHDPTTPASKPPRGRLHDGRIRGSNADSQAGEDGLSASDAGLDMDFFCGEAPALNAAGAPRQKRDHVFGQVMGLRGNPGWRQGDGQDEGEDDGYTRKRRRLAGLPVIAKYHTSLRFPLLDSFPDIFAPRSDQSHSISVQASLSTTSRISHRITALQKAVGTMVGLEEREALSNGLGEIGEAYTEGWDSGSDDDSDD